MIDTLSPIPVWMMVTSKLHERRPNGPDVAFCEILQIRTDKRACRHQPQNRRQSGDWNHDQGMLSGERQFHLAAGLRRQLEFAEEGPHELIGQSGIVTFSHNHASLEP